MSVYGNLTAALYLYTVYHDWTMVVKEKRPIYRRWRQHGTWSQYTNRY